MGICITLTWVCTFCRLLSMLVKFVVRGIWTPHPFDANMSDALSRSCCDILLILWLSPHNLYHSLKTHPRQNILLSSVCLLISSFYLDTKGLFRKGENHFFEKWFSHFSVFGKIMRVNLFSGENHFPYSEGKYFQFEWSISWFYVSLALTWFHILSLFCVYFLDIWFED